jgi:hypothetical protein
MKAWLPPAYSVPLEAIAAQYSWLLNEPIDDQVDPPSVDFTTLVE